VPGGSTPGGGGLVPAVNPKPPAAPIPSGGGSVPGGVVPGGVVPGGSTPGGGGLVPAVNPKPPAASPAPSPVIRGLW
jgi:hypothetical protein